MKLLQEVVQATEYTLNDSVEARSKYLRVDRKDSSMTILKGKLNLIRGNLR